MSGRTALAAGEYLRTWRQRRRISQLEFALEAEISQRHLSFLESGRSVPSRDMLLHLAERLEVPLRDRNAMLLAAGYAPVYAERSLEDPAMAAARQAIELVLKGHEPYPALAVDRHWNLVAANAALAPMLAGVADRALLEPPVNVLRLSLHPGDWRRVSPIWWNGERICLIGYAVRSQSPATQCSPISCGSCRPIPSTTR